MIEDVMQNREYRMKDSKKSGVMKRKSFTLVELLVVIVIIGILLGLLLPVVLQARGRAKVAKAKDAVTQLTVAWQSYLAEYRMFPSQNDDPSQPVAITKMDVLAVRILHGLSYNSLGGHKFMEFTTNEVMHGFEDPWSAPLPGKQTFYWVALDNGRDGDATAYDGKVKVPQEVQDLERSVAAWSWGPDQESSGGASMNDDVKSWK